METEKLLSLARALAESQSDVPFENIPEIDLYMDQLTTFFDDKLSGERRKGEDKILTKTMINNYTKDKLLPAPKNKKYSKEHMARLILIYHLKNCLSITDVKAVLDAADSCGVSLDDLYGAFIALRQTDNNRVIDSALSKLKETDTSRLCADEKSSALFAVFALISSSNAQKRLAERIIDVLLRQL